jgi:hypothetical protein
MQYSNNQMKQPYFEWYNIYLRTVAMRKDSQRL